MVLTYLDTLGGLVETLAKEALRRGIRCIIRYLEVHDMYFDYNL